MNHVMWSQLLVNGQGVNRNDRAFLLSGRTGGGGDR
jgi:hypothetical protein